MRARNASMTSTGDSCFCRISPASSLACIQQISSFLMWRCGVQYIRLANDNQIKAAGLRAVARSLFPVYSLFEKDGDYISFRDPTGHREAAWTFWLMRAYKPVLDATAELLRSTKTYGKDMKRDGYWLQKWSDTMTREAVLAALRLMPKDKEATLVDLGCGSADSLIAFCAGNTSRLGIGIDVDPLIAKLARQRVTDAGIGERIRIIHADILDLPQWQTNIQKTGEVVFLASGVLH